MKQETKTKILSIISTGMVIGLLIATIAIMLVSISNYCSINNFCELNKIYNAT